MRPLSSNSLIVREVTGKREDYTTFTYDVRPETEHIFLNNEDLIQIDITPLSHCKNLRTFSCSSNKLESIDLAPLKYCTNFRDLSGSVPENLRLTDTK